MNVGIYAGSFNPFHVGHLDIATKASKIFDKIYIVQATNKDKGEQQKLPKKTLESSGFITVELDHKDLLTDFISRIENRHDLYGAYANENVCIVRGLRNVHDFTYEQNLEGAYKALKPDIKIAYIFADPKYNFLSSSLLRGYPQEFDSFIVK